MVAEILGTILGAIIVLFVPGCALTFVLFKGGEIDNIERIVMSFALSIASVPLILFYLSWGFGIKINLINSLVVIFLIVLFSLIVWVKKRGIIHWRFKYN